MWRWWVVVFISQALVHHCPSEVIDLVRTVFSFHFFTNTCSRGELAQGTRKRKWALTSGSQPSFPQVPSPFPGGVLSTPSPFWPGWTPFSLVQWAVSFRSLVHSIASVPQGAGCSSEGSKEAWASVPGPLGPQKMSRYLPGLILLGRCRFEPHLSGIFFFLSLIFFGYIFGNSNKYIIIVFYYDWNDKNVFHFIFIVLYCLYGYILKFNLSVKIAWICLAKGKWFTHLGCKVLRDRKHDSFIGPSSAQGARQGS